jgi:hypothetical protein
MKALSRMNSAEAGIQSDWREWNPQKSELDASLRMTDAGLIPFVCRVIQVLDLLASCFLGSIDGNTW